MKSLLPFLRQKSFGFANEKTADWKALHAEAIGKVDENGKPLVMSDDDQVQAHAKHMKTIQDIEANEVMSGADAMGEPKQLGLAKKMLGNESQRSASVQSLISEEMKASGLGYDNAFARVQQQHPHIFSKMASPNLPPRRSIAPGGKLANERSFPSQAVIGQRQRSAQIQSHVAQEMKASNIDYTKAFTRVQDMHPELFT
jgi:hypothetical protein